MRAVEYHIELLALLHLLQQRPGILVPRGQLADFDFDVVPGRGFDELLQANQTWGMTGNDTITIPATSQGLSHSTLPKDNSWFHICHLPS